MIKLSKSKGRDPSSPPQPSHLSINSGVAFHTLRTMCPEIQMGKNQIKYDTDSEVKL